MREPEWRAIPEINTSVAPDDLPICGLGGGAASDPHRSSSPGVGPESECVRNQSRAPRRVRAAVPAAARDRVSSPIHQ